MPDQQRLKAVLQRVPSLKEKLRNRKIDETIIENTLADIDYRIKRYLTNEGTEGLYESDMKWLTLLLNEHMIHFQGLRFQIFPFDLTEIERSGYDHLPLNAETKKRFSKGMHCLNMHIPDGAIIGNTEIFTAAKTFFDEHFPEYQFKYFVIRSWLVYPRMVQLVKQDSNIVKFLKCFNTEAVSNSNKSQALQRIYGTNDLEKIKIMPKISSLQRNAFKNLDCLGVGFASRKYNTKIK